MRNSSRLYDEKEAEIGAPQMREVEKMILLRVVDNRWMDHIDAMDDLKQGIGLRSLGHIDPAIAYSNEGLRHVRGNDRRHSGRKPYDTASM